VLFALSAGCVADVDGEDEEVGEGEDVATTEEGLTRGTVKILASDADVVGVRNEDGDFWIAKKCAGASRLGAGKSRGPGHVFRLTAPVRGGGRNIEVVDDAAGPAGLPWGGLLSFGYHHARGTPPMQTALNQNAWLLGTRQCADDGGNGFGVARVRVSGPTKAPGAGGAVRITFDVDLRTPWTDPVMRVVYRYEFLPRIVNVWTTVTNMCTTPTCGDPSGQQHFVKEPKFMTLVERGIYDKLSVFDRNGKLLDSAGMTNAVVKTNQFAQPARSRAQFGFQGGACAVGRKCLDVVARSVDAGRAFGVPSFAWEGTKRGLDLWAVVANGLPRAAPNDGPSPRFGPQPWSCHSHDTAAQIHRRWEAGGQNAANAPIGPFFFFHGWEGGASPDDCEPLMRHFPGRQVSFSNYFAIRLTP
jgi:hypothetical protein